MLKERKCLMCKYLFRDEKLLFEHKCKAYPDGIPDEISIAYIAELNALYVNGQLYYRDNNKRQ